MKDSKGYYASLGVSENASDDEIKKAFRKKAVECHPDKFANDTEENRKKAEEEFKRINEAYSVLSDKSKREAYDLSGSDPFDGFESHGGWGVGMGEDLFRRHNMNSRRVSVGGDIKVSVTLNQHDMYFGTHKHLKIKKLCRCKRCHGTGSSDGTVSRCRRCDGSGTVFETYRNGYMTTRYSTDCPDCGGFGEVIENRCPACNGTGVVEDTEDVEFSIPKGVADGNVVRIIGKGNAGERKGNPGNLFVEVVEDPDDSYVDRDERGNITYRADLGFIDLVKGCSIEIPWIDRKLKISVKPGTEPGTVLRLSGKGFPDPNGYGYADYLVTVGMHVPSKDEFDEEDLELMESILKDK